MSDVVGASGRTDIEILVDCAHVRIPASHATAVGLILNELVTNAIKLAFNGQSGRLELRLFLEDGGRVGVLILSDDGPGLPSATANFGLGRTLVARLAKQIKADM